MSYPVVRCLALILLMIAALSQASASAAPVEPEENVARSVPRSHLTRADPPAAALRPPAGDIRIADRALAATLVQTALASPFFQSLVDRLYASDLIVYVTYDAALPSRLDGRLTFLGSGADCRYVLVAVAWGRGEPRLVATLAHELQHAVEIAERGEIVDTASLASAYRTLGTATSRGVMLSFETRRAARAAARVLAEVKWTQTAAPPAPELAMRP